MKSLMIAFAVLSFGLLHACDDETAEQATPETAETVAENTAENTANEAAEADDTNEAAEEPPAQQEQDPNEACVRVVVVAWQGAPHAAETVTRDRDAARERAEGLLARVDGGESIRDVAREASDASTSGPRGGIIGTYTREAWPAVYDSMKDAVFGLSIGGRTQVLEAEFGYVFAERCLVEKIHSSHILIRYAGARNADEDITRSQEAARQLAETLRSSLVDSHADAEAFANVARQRSEDGSAERGGDLGPRGRGLLAAEYEEAAFALAPGDISEVVESTFGFHIIRRME